MRAARACLAGALSCGGVAGAAAATIGHGTFGAVAVVFEGVRNGATLALAAILWRGRSRAAVLLAIVCAAWLGLVSAVWRKYNEEEMFPGTVPVAASAYVKSESLRIAKGVLGTTAVLALASRISRRIGGRRADALAETSASQYSLRTMMLGIAAAAAVLAVASYFRKLAEGMGPPERAALSGWLDVLGLAAFAWLGLWMIERGVHGAQAGAVALTVAGYAALIPAFAAGCVPEWAYSAVDWEFREASIADIGVLVERNALCAAVYIGTLLATKRFRRERVR